MSDFSRFQRFVVPSEMVRNTGQYADYTHQFFGLKESEIDEVDASVGIPFELNQFYRQVGYGFMYAQGGRPNRLLDPDSFLKVNLREGYYQNDPDLVLYSDIYEGQKALFFEVVEGVYLAIDKIETYGKNPVYYFRKKIAGSLLSFLDRFDTNPNLLAEIRDGSN